MQLMDLLFGKASSSRAAVLCEPPQRVTWRKIRPRADDTVRAHVAEADHLVATEHGGVLAARAGQDVVVDQRNGEKAVVRRDIFDRTYEPAGGGLYRKREDVVLRYFTLKKPVMVETMEGRQRAEAGDWIIEGVAGELWPVARDKALEKYEPL